MQRTELTAREIKERTPLPPSWSEEARKVRNARRAKRRKAARATKRPDRARGLGERAGKRLNRDVCGDWSPDMRERAANRRREYEQANARERGRIARCW